MADRARLRFFLGGLDLEMQAIAALVRRILGDEAVVDRGLAWGARAEDYAAPIAAWRAAGGTAVLVELAPDDICRPAPDAIFVDHHGPRAAEPAALRQVFDLLGLPPDAWRREEALIAANDVGHVAAMRRMGATPAEVARIRAADRRAQGITPEEEATGRSALDASRRCAGGRRLVVTLPHGRTATVMDPLALEAGEAAGVGDVLVLCPGGAHFFGGGDAVAALDAAFGGWCGGELPVRGFWGVALPVAEGAVVRVLTQAIKGRAPD